MSVDLSELVAHQVAEGAPFAARRRVNLGLAEDSQQGVTVLGDVELLGVLVRNLVDNAIRYTPAGGRVDVVVRREGESVVLRVTDSGPGIPPEERARALERFYRGPDRAQSGSGLGLSIVARIAQLHGAVLTLDDPAAGRGLSVRVALPPPGSG